MTQYARRHPDCAFREVADEGGLVVLPGRAEVKVLSPTAITIFSLLDGEHSPQEIARRIAEEYEVAEATALEDIQAFVAQLAEHGMLAGTADEEGARE
jgi:hypothetical protein